MNFFVNLQVSSTWVEMRNWQELILTWSACVICDWWCESLVPRVYKHARRNRTWRHQYAHMHFYRATGRVNKVLSMWFWSGSHTQGDACNQELFTDRASASLLPGSGFSKKNTHQQYPRCKAEIYRILQFTIKLQDDGVLQLTISCTMFLEENLVLVIWHQYFGFAHVVVVGDKCNPPQWLIIMIDAPQNLNLTYD